MINFESKSVGELRVKLVESGVFTEEQANAIKGKALVVFEVKKLLASGDLDESDFDAPKVAEPEEELLNTLEESNDIDYSKVTDDVNYEELEAVASPAYPDKEEVKEVTQKKIPNVTSPEWQDFVLSQFTDDEVVEIHGKKYPMVIGLRRVAELLLGEIIFSGPINIFPSDDGNNSGRASVLYRIDISWRLNVPEYLNIETGLPIRTFQASAEAWDGSIHDERFKPFPLTIAETRAEGRTLRKALFLKTLAAEELSGSELPTKESINAVVEYDENEPITKQQLGIIRTKCLQYKIDVDKFAPDIEHLTKKNAVDLIKRITLIMTGVEKIPEDLLIKE